MVFLVDRASGVQLIQEGIAEGVRGIKRYVPQGDKQMRLYAQTATIENGFVYVPREAAWLAEYLHELSDLSEVQIRRPARLYLASARLDQAGFTVIECFELQLKRTFLWRDIMPDTRQLQSPRSFDCRSNHRMGGHRVQGRRSGKTARFRERLLEYAAAVERAGAFTLLLEGIPAELARGITERASIPTTLIGAGVECDGQVLSDARRTRTQRIVLTALRQALCASVAGSVGRGDQLYSRSARTRLPNA